MGRALLARGIKGDVLVESGAHMTNKINYCRSSLEYLLMLTKQSEHTHSHVPSPYHNLRSVCLHQ